MKLTRTNRDGRRIPETYYTTDHLYEIERGTVGWNINRWTRWGWYEYSFSADTLAEARESLADRYAHGNA